MSRAHHFYSLSDVKTKPHQGADDADHISVDTGLDLVTLTEPDLAVFLVVRFE